MFEITIKGDTPAELVSNMETMLSEFAGSGTVSGQAEIDVSKLAVHKPKGKTQATTSEPEAETDEPIDPEDEELEPAKPMPETAKQIVDAGTGRPAATTVKMTAEDVKVAAAKLAAKDSPTLAGILKTYGAAKLSEVPKGKLADFASDVMEALG